MSTFPSLFKDVTRHEPRQSAPVDKMKRHAKRRDSGSSSRRSPYPTVVTVTTAQYRPSE